MTDPLPTFVTLIGTESDDHCDEPPLRLSHESERAMRKRLESFHEHRRQARAKLRGGQ